MRFIFVSVLCVFLVGVVLFTTRIWGQGQTYPTYQHAFFKENQELTVLKAQSIEQIRAAIAQKSDLVVWVDARLSNDNIIYVLAKENDAKFLNAKRKEQEEKPTEQIMTGGKLSNYSWAQIHAFFPEAVEMKEYLTAFPQTRFIVNVLDNVQEVHAHFAQQLTPLNPDERILIQSDTLVIMTTIKELKPAWLYGTAHADLMRLMSFESLWILPAVQFKGDVLIAPFTLLKRPAFTEAGVQEMQRRHKKVLLGPIDTKEQLAEARRLKVDGVIVSDLSVLEK